MVSFFLLDLYYVRVLWPGARLRNKVHPTTVMKLLWDFA